MTYPNERKVVAEIIYGLGRKKKLLHITPCGELQCLKLMVMAIEDDMAKRRRKRNKKKDTHLMRILLKLNMMDLNSMKIRGLLP